MPKFDEIILFPVSEKRRPPFWISISSFYFLPNFRHWRDILHWRTIFRQNRTTLGGVDVISIFSIWRPAAILDLIWITLDHPRSVIVGPRYKILKFGVDRIHSFGDIVIFIFCRFGLKLSIHAHWGGGWGIFPPDDVTHYLSLRKALPYAETRCFSHKA